MQSLLSTKTPTDLLAYSLLVGIYLVRFLYIGTLEIAPDEAYYWDWSRNLSFGYYDHPPMVAWFIYLSTKLFGDTLLGIKFIAITASLLAMICSYHLAKKYVTRTPPLLLFILLSNSVIIYGVGCLVTVPDIPMIFFWSLGLVCAYKFIFEGSRLSWFYLGLTMGMGLLSKYIFVLFILSLVVFLVCSKSHRHLVRSGRLCGALLIALIVFVPNILWNFKHHWITALFQLNHGLGTNSCTHIDFLGEFISGQIGVLSIFPFIVLTMALMSELKHGFHDSKKGFLILFLIIPFLFFAISSLQKRVEANWASPAYISGLILVPIFWETLRKTGKRTAQKFIIVSIGISCAALIVIMVHIKNPFLPLPPAMDPTSQVRGWKQWAAAVHLQQERIDPELTMAVCANRYQEAALLGFYLPNHPKTVSLNINSRENNYSLSETRNYLFLKNLLFVYPITDTLLPHEIARHFDLIRPVGPVFVWQGPHKNSPYYVFNVVLKKNYDY